MTRKIKEFENSIGEIYRDSPSARMFRTRIPALFIAMMTIPRVAHEGRLARCNFRAA